MISRTTNLGQYMYSNYMLTYNQNKLQDNQYDVMMGKKVSKPSDDPVNTGLILNLKKQLTDNATYSKSINTISSELSTSDTILGKVTDKLIRAKELAISAASESNGDDAIKAVKSELEQTLASLADMANTKYNGIYIFSGTSNLTKAFTVNANDGSIVYSGTRQNQSPYRQVEIGPDLKVTINESGDKIFGEYDPNNNLSYGAFGYISEIVNALEQNPADIDIINENIDKIQSSIDEVVNIRTKLGVVAQHVDEQKELIDSKDINTSEHKTSLEEIDLVDAITSMVNQKYALEASMKVSSSILSTTLLNYI